MKSLVVAVFNTEASARRAMRWLDDLAFNGEIDLYQRSLIQKKPDGAFKVFKGDVSAGWETLGGAALGSLIGIPVGPVGFVTGMVAGAVVGSAVSDLGQNAFGRECLRYLSTDVPAGSTLIVAQIGEKNPAFVDENLRSFGADISRHKISGPNEEIETVEE
jgi:uncharacterized membrane protein